MTAPDPLRSLRRALDRYDPPRHPNPGVLADLRRDWWDLWWRRQKRRHRTQLAAAAIIGVLVGRAWPR